MSAWRFCLGRHCAGGSDEFLTNTPLLAATESRQLSVIWEGADGLPLSGPSALFCASLFVRQSFWAPSRATGQRGCHGFAASHASFRSAAPSHMQRRRTSSAVGPAPPPHTQRTGTLTGSRHEATPSGEAGKVRSDGANPVATTPPGRWASFWARAGSWSRAPEPRESAGFRKPKLGGLEGAAGGAGGEGGTAMVPVFTAGDAGAAGAAGAAGGLRDHPNLTLRPRGEVPAPRCGP